MRSALILPQRTLGKLESQVESEGQGEDCMMRMEALIQELEDTKKTYMISAGTVCSLRRELSIKDRDLTLARAEGAELKQELKDRMAQLQAMSRKFSCLREGKANEELIAALENENCSLRQLTAQLKEEASQQRQEAARVSDEVQRLQKALEMERVALAKLQQRDQANQGAIAALQLQHSRAKVSLEQTRTRFERLRGRIIQAAYAAPGAKPPQTEISDAALLQAMQKIVDDRTELHQRLHQNGEKLPSLATVETHGVRNTSVTAEKQKPKT
ncbi:hypothetical protein GJAV_G00187460 [Gymnothorax javanicus]|nr:hypothetical protein GJAV_G00187460 [Gymnothorax javanicus]